MQHGFQVVAVEFEFLGEQGSEGGCAVDRRVVFHDFQFFGDGGELEAKSL